MMSPLILTMDHRPWEVQPLPGHAEGIVFLNIFGFRAERPPVTEMRGGSFGFVVGSHITCGMPYLRRRSMVYITTGFSPMGIVDLGFRSREVTTEYPYRQLLPPPTRSEGPLLDTVTDFDLRRAVLDSLDFTDLFRSCAKHLPAPSQCQTQLQVPSWLDRCVRKSCVNPSVDDSGNVVEMVQLGDFLGDQSTHAAPG